MRFWWRELAGWLLVFLGLALSAACLMFLSAGMIFEAGPLTLIAVIIFRGGIHLLKVAVAARICLEAVEPMRRSVGERGRRGGG